MPSQSVDIILNAQSEGFKKAFADAEARAGKFYKNVRGQSKRTSKSVVTDTEKMAAGLKRFTVAAAGVAGISIGVSGIQNLFNQVRESSDELNKFARRIGVSVDEIQKFGFVASQVGIQQQTFNTSIDRFTKRIGEAKDGLGPAVLGFKQLGIEIKDSDGSIKSTSILFREVADEVAKIADPAEQAAVAARLFGREGIVMVNALKGGAEALDEFGAEAERLGFIVPEQLLANAESLTDEFDRLSRVTDAKLTAAFLELAPTIETIARAIREAVQDGGIEKLQEGLLFLGKVLLALKVASLAAKAETAALTIAYYGLGKGASFAAIKTALLAKSMNLLLKVTKIGIALAAVEAVLYQFGLSAFNATEDFEELDEALEKSGAAGAESFAKNAEKVKDSLSDIEIANRKLREELAKSQETTPLKRYTDAFTQAKKAETKAAQDAVNAQKKLRDEQQKALETAEENLKSIKERFQDAFSELAQGPEQEPTRLIDGAQFTASARQALVSGDSEKAIKDADKARETLLKLKETGDISTLALQGALKEAQRVATQAGEAQVQSEEQKLKPIQDALDELNVRAEKLKNIKIGFAEADVNDSVDSLAEKIQKRLDSKVVLLKLGVDTDAMRDAAPGFATGGYISGPGTKTSDSILARLSRGEFVVKAKAVDQYGVGLLRAINDLQFPTKLPAFAQGGPVGRPVNLNLNGQSFAMNAGADVVADLQRHVRMQALAQGRRT